MTYATWSFQFNAATTAPPTGNQVRLDNVDQVAATHLFVMHSTNDGLDVGAALALVSPGDHIRIQDFDDDSRWQTYNVTAADHTGGTWSDFTVVWVNGATAVPAQKVALTVFAPDAPGIPPGGDVGDVLVKTGVEDFAVAWQTPDGSSVPSPITAGCEDWPITWACDIADVNPALLDAAEDAARSILWAYGGRNIGRCLFTEGYYPPCGGCPGAPY